MSMSMMEQAALKMLQNMTGLTPEAMQHMAAQAINLLSNLDARLAAIENNQAEILAFIRGESMTVINGEISHAETRTDN